MNFWTLLGFSLSILKLRYVMRLINSEIKGSIDIINSFIMDHYRYCSDSIVPRRQDRGSSNVMRHRGASKRPHPHVVGVNFARV